MKKNIKNKNFKRIKSTTKTIVKQSKKIQRNNDLAKKHKKMYNEVDRIVRKMAQKKGKKLTAEQKAKLKVLFYAYTFDDEKINDLFFDFVLDNNLYFSSFKSLILNIGRVAKSNLFMVDDFTYPVSKEYLSLTNNHNQIVLFKKFLLPLRKRRHSIKYHKAERYDLDGFYFGYHLRGKGQMINLKKFTTNLLEVYKRNFKKTEDGIKFIGDKTTFLNELRVAVKASKLKKTKKTNTKRSKIKFYIPDPENSLLKVTKPKIKNTLFDVEEDNIKTFYIPRYNANLFLKEMKKTKGSFDFHSYMETPAAAPLYRKYSKLLRDHNMYFSDPEYVTINGKEYLKVTYEESVSEKTGRIFHLINSTSKLGRNLLLNNFYSIDVSNMAGYSIYLYIANIISINENITLDEAIKETEKRFPLFSLYAKDRDSFFKSFIEKLESLIDNNSNKLSNQLKSTLKGILKKIFLSILFSKVYKGTFTSIKNGNFNDFRVKDLARDIVKIAEDEGYLKDKDHKKLGIIVNALINNESVITDFTNEVKDIAIYSAKFSRDNDSNNSNNTKSTREAKKDLSSIFMNIETNLIQPIVHFINNELEKSSSPLRAVSIHDEFCTPILNSKIIDFIIDQFNFNEMEMDLESINTTKKLLFKKFRTKITYNKTGKKLSFKDFKLPIKDIDPDYLEDYLNSFGIENINSAVKYFGDKSLLDLTESDIYKINHFKFYEGNKLDLSSFLSSFKVKTDESKETKMDFSFIKNLFIKKDTNYYNFILDNNLEDSISSFNRYLNTYLKSLESLSELNDTLSSISDLSDLSDLSEDYKETIIDLIEFKCIKKSDGYYIYELEFKTKEYIISIIKSIIENKIISIYNFLNMIYYLEINLNTLSDLSDLSEDKKDNNYNKTYSIHNRNKIYSPKNIDINKTILRNYNIEINNYTVKFTLLYILLFCKIRGPDQIYFYGNFL